MFGFLFKILLVAGLVGGVGYFVFIKKQLPIPSALSGVKPADVVSKLPLDKEALGNIKNLKAAEVLAKVSGALDSLVTHQSGGAGPVVLGMKVSNDSISTVVDVLQSLPPEQINQIRSALCATPPTN